MVGTQRMKDDDPMSACTDITVTYKTHSLWALGQETQ